MSQSWRVFLNFPGTEDPQLSKLYELSERDNHHLKDVLRLKDGSPVTVVCKNSGKEYAAQVVYREEQIFVSLTEAISTNATVKHRVSSLSFAFCKGKRNEVVCEKACELGVNTLILWQAEHSVVKLRSLSELNAKKARFERILEAAAKQSHKTAIPTLYLAFNVKEVLDILKQISDADDRRFCCSLLSEASPLKELASPEAGVHLLVGPEGDLSKGEEDILLRNKFEAVTLGPTVLRSDTAAIAAIAMSQALWGYSL